MARLLSVVLLVRDVSRCARFYREGLGLAELSRAPDGAFARLALPDGGATLDLRAASGEAQCCAGYSPLLAFGVDDMDEAVPRLLEMGATLDGSVRYEGYGKTAAVRSPDGHMVGLYEAAGLPGDGDEKVAAGAAARIRIDKNKND